MLTMKHWVRQAGLRAVSLVLLCLFGSLLSATLVRFAPGSGVDEREIDPRLSPESKEAIRASNPANLTLLTFYEHYLRGMVHGDLGNSQWLQRPVNSLIRERFPETLRSVLLGTCFAWFAALALGLTVILYPSFALEVSGTLLTGLLIALPVAVVAMLAVYSGAPVSVAIAAVLFPKLFRYVRNLLAHANVQPHILAAQARGIGRARILSHHILPCVSPALCALLGVSLSMAFGAAIPIEALCDSPGIGQLAWQATLNRDLPLMMNLTLLATVITVGANWLANFGDRRMM
jgi:peptide/nickel transport system permease protein